MRRRMAHLWLGLQLRNYWQVQFTHVMSLPLYWGQDDRAFRTIKTLPELIILQLFLSPLQVSSHARTSHDTATATWGAFSMILTSFTSPFRNPFPIKPSPSSDVFPSSIHSIVSLPRRFDAILGLPLSPPPTRHITELMLEHYCHGLLRTIW